MSGRNFWYSAGDEAKVGPFEFSFTIIPVSLLCHHPKGSQENRANWQECQKTIRSRFIINVIIFKLEINTIMKCPLFLDLGAPR